MGVTPNHGDAVTLLGLPVQTATAVAVAVPGGGSYAQLPGGESGAIVVQGFPVFEHPRDITVLAARPERGSGAGQLKGADKIELGLRWDFWPNKGEKPLCAQPLYCWGTFEIPLGHVWNNSKKRGM